MFKKDGYHLEEMGRITAERILYLIDNPGTSPARVIVSTDLVIRKSCSAV